MTTNLTTTTPHDDATEIHSHYPDNDTYPNDQLIQQMITTMDSTPLIHHLIVIFPARDTSSVLRIAILFHVSFSVNIFFLFIAWFFFESLPT